MEKAIIKTIEKGFTIVFKPDYDIKNTFRLEIYKGGGYVYDTLPLDFRGEDPITWQNKMDYLIKKHKLIHSNHGV